MSEDTKHPNNDTTASAPPPPQTPPSHTQANTRRTTLSFLDNTLVDDTHTRHATSTTSSLHTDTTSHIQSAKPVTQKVREYSGKVAEDVEDWIVHYMEVKLANGWDSKYCLRLMGSCLSGAAGQWWQKEGKAMIATAMMEGTRDDDILQSVLKAIVKRFGDPMKEENARIQVKSRIQRKGETVREYMSALDDLFTKAEIDGAKEKQRYFEDGLRGDIKRKVLEVIPKSLTEAYTTACMYETIQARMDGDTRHSTRPSQVGRLSTHTTTSTPNSYPTEE
jgi:hypothetical protein